MQQPFTIHVYHKINGWIKLGEILPEHNYSEIVRAIQICKQLNEKLPKDIIKFVVVDATERIIFNPIDDYQDKELDDLKIEPEQIDAQQGDISWADTSVMFDKKHVYKTSDGEDWAGYLLGWDSNGYWVIRDEDKDIYRLRPESIICIYEYSH